MYVKLNCKIEIEKKDGTKLSFTALNHLETDKSIYVLGSTAKIKIPTSARLKREGQAATDSVQTAKQFERGDKISIKLGYGDGLENEFKGFIYRINFTIPLEIECEGYEFQLRRPADTRLFTSTTLKDLLTWAITGTDIRLSGNIPGITLKNHVVPVGKTMLEVVQDIKDKYGLTAYFVDDELYVGLAYVPDLGTVKYSLGVNTIKDNELKYRSADDVKLKVKAIWAKKDNTKIEAHVGDQDGQERTLFFFNVSSKEELQKLAEQEIKKYKYDGYEGKVTAFLQPFSKPGMKAEIVDTKYNERAGTYYITSTKVIFGMQGGRRINELGIKL